MKTGKCILLIEDSRFDAELILYHVQKYSIIEAYERVYCETDMREALKKQRWDLILSDHVMPSFDSLGALSVRNELCPDVPFVIVSNGLEESLINKAYEKGCLTCISKDNLKGLEKVLV